MDTRLIEIVPNISEGRDQVKIKAITDVVETVEGVLLLDSVSLESTLLLLESTYNVRTIIENKKLEIFWCNLIC